MRHFYRSRLSPDRVLALADDFFERLQASRISGDGAAREYRSPLGTAQLTVWMEGGHYTFVQIDTDQMGESRLDRNAKRFFTELHRAEDPAHALTTSF